MSAILFEHIKEECPKKKVISLCNKLIKHFSFSSEKDRYNLCDLTFWLYVYGHENLVMQCIALMEDLTDFRAEINEMWGLKIRVLRAQGQQKEADMISSKIDTALLSFRKYPSKEIERRKRIVIGKENGISDVSYQTEIEQSIASGATNRVISWKLLGVRSMLGHLETGLYPFLNDHRERVEQTITAYIADLQKVK